MYERSQAWNDIPGDVGNDCETLIQDPYTRIERASSEAIHQVKWSKFYPKPWWNDDLKQSKHKREILYQKYRHDKTYNMVAWKRCRAQHKALIRKSKKQAWREFVAKMKWERPSSTIYETIRKIKGQQQRKIHILKENEESFTTVTEIVTKLAQSFSRIESDANFCREFVRYKATVEQKGVNFNSSNTEPYNRPYTNDELRHIISCTTNTAPEPMACTIKRQRECHNTQKNICAR